MIGDWVMCTHLSINRPVRVEELHVMIFDDIRLVFTPRDIEPIPLTKEILEKNGWVWNNLPFEQYWEQYGLCLYYVGNGYRINCGINVCMVVDSVHQLQHVLKLCEIEKEIEL